MSRNTVDATCINCGRPIRWLSGSARVCADWPSCEPATVDNALPSQGQAQPFDLVGSIIAYEQGDLGEEETVNLFQNLIDTGLAWQLQGRIGRTAASLIEQGICSR